MKLLLLDGHNLLYRAFTSLPSAIVDASGRPVHGVYGMVSATLRLIRDTGASHVVAAFDVPDIQTFRQQQFPAYQAQRGPMGGEHAEDFLRQTGVAAEVLPQMGVLVVTLPGFEADDVMGTLAQRAAGAGDSAIIVSTDRDLLQLVQSGVEVLVPGNPPRTFATAQDVLERLGVPPEGVTSFKALAGDASDNIPGVAGIGSKTAAMLVTQYGHLDEIAKHLDELPKRAATALTAQLDLARLFLELVTVSRDAPVKFDLVDLPEVKIAPDLKVREILARAGY